MTDASTLIGANFHALLIGIDCYLPNKLPEGASYKNLNGGVRDINHVEAFLKNTLKLPESQIMKLTASNAEGWNEPSESNDLWPTYENIVGKFNELIEKAQPQDQVYIHYSGHGGRAATIFPEIKGEKYTEETNIFKVFATVGEANFRWLELPALDQPIPPSRARGLQAPRNELEEILAAVGADEQLFNGKRVEVVVPPNRGWTTKQVAVKVIAN